jgi:hypothetical protein
MTTGEETSSAAAPAIDAAAAAAAPAPPFNCPNADAAPTAAPAAAAAPDSAGGPAHPGSAVAAPPEAAAAAAAPRRFVAPPSTVNGPDFFNIDHLQTRPWDRPVISQERVGMHMNDLLIYYCLLSDAFQESLLRINPQEDQIPVWKNQLNLCMRLMEYREVLFEILENYRNHVASNLGEIQRELDRDRDNLGNVTRNLYNRGKVTDRPPTVEEKYFQLEDRLKTYTLLNELEDGLAKHLMGIMNAKKPGLLLNRENLIYFLRFLRFR